MATSDVKEGGVSVKYGLTSNLTLDFTFNPDFSQIESDRAQVDVNQRFPLFFPELRPFFLEGQEIFSIPGPVTLVHTRTIVDPRYGAKITGKVGKTTVGLPRRRRRSAGQGRRRADPAFGRSATNVFGRVRYDLYSESSVGLIVTDREFGDQHSRVGRLRQPVQDRAQSAAVLQDRSGRATATSRASTVRATWWTPTSGRRGAAWRIRRRTTRSVPSSATDSGFVRRTNERQGSANVSYRWWPQNWIVNWGPRFNYNRNYEFSGRCRTQGIGLGWNAQFDRNININVNTDRDMERYNAVDFDKVRYGMGVRV